MATQRGNFYDPDRTYTREEFDALLRELAAREDLARRDLSALTQQPTASDEGAINGGGAGQYVAPDGTAYRAVYVDAQGRPVDQYIDGPEGRMVNPNAQLGYYETILDQGGPGQGYNTFRLDPASMGVRDDQDWLLAAQYNPDGTLREVTPRERRQTSTWQALRPAAAMAALAAGGGFLNAALNAPAAAGAGAGTAGAGMSAGEALAAGIAPGPVPTSAAVAGGAGAAGAGAATAGTAAAGGGGLSGLTSLLTLDNLREAAPLIAAGVGAAASAATADGATGGSGEASRRAMELGDDVFEWFKTNYSDVIKPLQEEQAQVARETAQRGGRIADKEEARADETFDRYRSTFQPVENALVENAMQFDQRGFQDRAAALASADIQSQFTQAEQQLNRDLARMGVQPSAGQALATRRALALSRAANMGAAANQARADADATGFARKQVVAELGRDVARDAAGRSALALTAGEGAISGANAGLSGATAAANTMGQGFGQALSAFNAAGNQASLQSSANLRADSNRNELIGTLAGAAGQYFAGGKKKKAA